MKPQASRRSSRCFLRDCLFCGKRNVCASAEGTVFRTNGTVICSLVRRIHAQRQIKTRRPAVRIASIRVKLRNYAEVARFEAELSDALPPECVGPLRGVLWHRCADSGSLEAEPFVELKKRASLRGPYEMKELP